MARLFWTVVGTLAALWVLLEAGAFSGRLEILVARVVYTAWSLACPLFLIALIWAPGLFRAVTEPFSLGLRRMQSRRNEREELQAKVERLGKAHHMNQLGNYYQRLGRTRRAAEWFAAALEKEPDLLDARYRLGLCRYDQRRYEEAAELLEQVHAEKPNHDYGHANLRLAQSQQKLGNLQRATEVYEQLLQHYPGQPEGSYTFAMLAAEQGNKETARGLLTDMVRSLRMSPGFQRRRNRHWAIKARWWLLWN